MRNLIFFMALSLWCSPALAVGPIIAPQTAPMAVAHIQAMQINEIIRMKIENANDFAATGMKGLRAGEDVEVRKVAKDKLEVKRLGTGEIGVMPVQ